MQEWQEQILQREGFNKKPKTTIMHNYFTTPNREEQRVFEVYSSGLLDAAFYKYDEALAQCRYLTRVGYETKMRTRYLDESEY